jgi:hypothetical protein
LMPFDLEHDGATPRVASFRSAKSLGQLLKNY